MKPETDLLKDTYWVLCWNFFFNRYVPVERVNCHWISIFQWNCSPYQNTEKHFSVMEWDLNKLQGTFAAPANEVFRSVTN